MVPCRVLLSPCLRPISSSNGSLSGFVIVMPYTHIKCQWPLVADWLFWFSYRHALTRPSSANGSLLGVVIAMAYTHTKRQCLLVGFCYRHGLYPHQAPMVPCWVLLSPCLKPISNANGSFSGIVIVMPYTYIKCQWFLAADWLFWFSYRHGHALHLYQVPMVPCWVLLSSCLTPISSANGSLLQTGCFGFCYRHALHPYQVPMAPCCRLAVLGFVIVMPYTHIKCQWPLVADWLFWFSYRHALTRPSTANGSLLGFVIVMPYTHIKLQ